jgi:hypothetical protein
MNDEPHSNVFYFNVISSAVKILLISLHFVSNEYFAIFIMNDIYAFLFIIMRLQGSMVKFKLFLCTSSRNTTVFNTLI